MSEEIEKKEKPKATLIKHNKAVQKTEMLETTKTEKKKVVVVKKKKKPVVKVVHKTTEQSSTQDSKSVNKDAVNDGVARKTKSNSVKSGKVDGKPLGGSRKGRSQDDIFKNKPSETVTSENKETSLDNTNKQATSVDNRSGRNYYSKPNNNQRVTSNTKDNNYRRESSYNRSNSGNQGRSDDNRSSGYQNRPNDNRSSGYQNRPNDNRSSGYQNRPNENRSSGYQNRPNDNRSSGYQNRPNENRSSGYQNRPNDNRSSGYQNRPNDNRSSGYQNRPADNRSGGYQGRPNYNRNANSQGRPTDNRNNNFRPGGYNNSSNSGGNYQSRPGDSRNVNRSEGYNNRPNNFRGKPGGAPGRPGGFRGKTSGGNNTEPSVGAENKKNTGRKVFKTKKKNDYKKKDDFEKEKNFQIKKKSIKRVNPVPSEIEMLEAITVSDLARKMNLKASDLIAKLMGMGMMVTINQPIDVETAELIAAEYNCKIKRVSLYDETIIESDKDTDDSLKPRAPIVAVMGHVDHGKTKLLDAIRKTDIVAGEHGGITQHIGASKVAIAEGSIVFLDTPGHEAFTLMRARGAKVTDIVVLIVAANDGVMPQTIEAINHAKEAKVPIVVAINKCDLPEANIDRVKQQLSEYELMPESWGGSTLFAEISALKGTGIKDLLDAILLQSEILELKASADCRAEGTVIESRVDQGRGIVSSVIIERGTLKVGDSFVAGIFPGKVRALFDDKGEKISEAGPSTPVEILGFTGVPNAGSPFQVTENEKMARMVGEKRQELEKLGKADGASKITLDNLYDSIQEGSVQELKVIIKGDVHGSVEALQSSLKKLSTDEIKLTPIHSAAGAIVENDVNLASASNAIIIGFHVRPTPKALALAEQEKVDIRKYTIIYDAVADIKSAMEGMLAPELSEETLGTVEVREVFKVPKIGLIAGCYVKTGKVRRGESTHVIRDGVILHSGKITSLKRFKDDAKEVESGYECGIGIENYLDVKVGDEFEVYTIKETARNLD